MIKSLLWLFFCTVCIFHSETFAAYQNLAILHPRASGTGAPAIPSTHRIFYAYPGIEYKIRVAAVGGDYPYTYTLRNAPSGMTVDTSGYIRWPSPVDSASNITVRVTDSLGAYTEQSWAIAVQGSNFKFVDCTQGSNGSGAVSSPYNSIENMVAGASATDIIYFRSGTCSVPARGGHTIGNASAFVFNLPSSTAAIWMAYPGESVTLDLGSNRYFYGATNVPFYFSGIRFYQGREYFFRTQNSPSSQNYVTFLDNIFDTLTLERTDYNSNQGTYFSDPTEGQFLTFQGNTFSGYRGTQGIGSLYRYKNTLVENNHFSDFESPNATNQVLAFKTECDNLTVRGNVIILSASSEFGIMGGSTNGMFADTENIEILYNYFRQGNIGGIGFNKYNTQGATWVYRNTFVSSVQMTNLDADCDGPWTINSNVFQNTDSGLSYHDSCNGDYTACVSQTGNVGATSGVVDSSGKLLSSYTDSVGVAGWQFADGSTPMDATPTIIRGGRLSGSLSGGGVLR